jgi:hypothetical protein
MIAAVSIRPLPSAFATFTFPATIASTRPGTEERLATQFKRIAKAIVHASQNHIDLLQPVDCLEIDTTLAHGQVSSLHEGEAQIARDIGVLKISLVQGSGSKQNDSRIIALR